MSDQGFADQLRQIAAAVSLARASHVTRSNSLRRGDEAAGARLRTAGQSAAAGRSWADERLAEVAVIVDQGERLLPDEVEPVGDRPPPASLTAVPSNGIEVALEKAQTQVDEIREWGLQLRGWRERRSAIIRALLILLLLIAIAIGLLWLWRTIQARAEETAATQTAVAIAAAPTQTAVSLMTTQEAIATREAQQLVEDGGTGETAGANGENQSTDSTPIPTLTSGPPTRTPRPPPTSGPTPTSLPPGAIVCPGAFTTRLTVGGRARVINYQLNVRAGPGTHHSIVRRLDIGRTVDVLDGPVCDNGQLWYYILSEEIFPRDGSPSYRAEGWLVEESGETYYLEPIQ